MTPVTLMRLRKLGSPDDLLDRYSSDDLIVQPKFDGYLALVGTDEDGRIQIRTRRGNDVTDRAPSVVAALSDALPPETWLLGELVYVTPEGTMNLHGLQSIMKRKGDPDAGPGEVRFFVFDLLRLDGEPYERFPYRDRVQRAGVFVRRAGHPVYEAGAYRFDELPDVVAESLAMGGEGAVIKAADGDYRLRPFGQNEAFGEQWKYKPPEKARTADVILTDYTKGKAKRIFTAVQVRDGAYFEVGKLSGLDRATEDAVAARIDDGEEVVVEVTYQETLKSGKMRHMGWSRLREDKPLSSVTFEEPQMAKAKSKSKSKSTKGKSKGKKKAPRKNPKGDLTQARAFILDCIGSHHVKNGHAVNRDVCCEAYKNAGGTKKDCNAALRELKDDGWIEIKKRECRLTPKGMMHFVQASGRPVANPMSWQDEDTVVMTDPDTDMQVTVSRVEAADIDIRDLDDPRRSMRVMTPSFDQALAEARDLTNNPRRGMPSMTRPGRQDYRTHRGDMDYHRAGHDVVPRPYTNPSDMYRQGVIDRLHRTSRRRNPDFQYARDLSDEAAMQESRADMGIHAMATELEREGRMSDARARRYMDAIREHMNAAIDSQVQLAQLEDQDETDYGASAEVQRLDRKLYNVEQEFSKLKN